MIGTIIGGTLSQTLDIALAKDRDPESINVGDYLVVTGKCHEFYCIVADLEMECGEEQKRVVVNAKPILMRRLGTGEIAPVTTLPGGLAAVRVADETDVKKLFEQGDRSFEIGHPPTMPAAPISIDMKRFAQRSNGVFGQTGTGKSFLVRLLACGLIQMRVASTLIFDMHNEYSFGKESEDGVRVKGIKHFFGSRVAVIGLDHMGEKSDALLHIGMDQIEPGDILLLGDELNLRGTTEVNVEMLYEHFGKNWLRELLTWEVGDLRALAEDLGLHPGSVVALRRKLRRIQRRPYVAPTTTGEAVNLIVDKLAANQHVILHFGRCDTSLDHILVANILTRRVRERWQRMVAKHERTQDPGDKPPQLVIVLEEAHKFLSPAHSRQTIFGTIARELRKYRVTLVLVDQRPAGIDAEVLSQLGTRITGKLTEARDIEAVLTGVADKAHLRTALASMPSRERFLMAGHAAPVPIILQPRKYDETFYAAVTTALDADQARAELFEP
jgi:hypothetical protein